MIDIHSHLLPGIDDGPRSVERPVAVLERFADEGVSDVILTPHARSSDLSMDAEDAIEQREIALVELLKAAPSDPTLHLGFEILMDQPLPAAVLGDKSFSLAGSKFWLVEFYKSVAADSIARALEMLANADMVPVVAHVERYDAAIPENVRHWRSVGAKMQVDAREYLRDSTRGRNARLLTSQGLIDFAASDNHGDKRSLAMAKLYFAEAGHAEVGRMLCETNPRAVVENGDVEPVPPVKLKEGLKSRLKGALGL